MGREPDARDCARLSVQPHVPGNQPCLFISSESEGTRGREAVRVTGEGGGRALSWWSLAQDMLRTTAGV